MKYTGPKFKLCRREQVDLFGSPKYNIKKNRNLPGQHGAAMQRLSEYGKLLRNKQVLKRTYLLTERQFGNIVKEISAKFSKNKNVPRDVALYQFLERRVDSMLYRSGLAKTIMQARQMVVHSHLLLNGKKHNIPSTFLEIGDVLTIKEKLQKSPLYTQILADNNKGKLPSWVKVNKNAFSVEVLSLPLPGELGQNADLLKVIEYYARA
jgi:small subunit ribosomal protein S4